MLPPPSPRPRAASRHSAAFQIRLARPETSKIVQTLRHTLARLTQLRSLWLRFPRNAGGSVSCSLVLLFSCWRLSQPLVKRERLARRNFDTELQYPYRYRFEPNDRLESVATRTPPPICTSAPILNPRWSQEPWAQRTFLQIHQASFPAMKMIPLNCPQLRLCVSRKRHDAVMRGRKVLNLCIDSNWKAGVTF